MSEEGFAAGADFVIFLEVCLAVSVIDAKRTAGSAAVGAVEEAFETSEAIA